MKKKIIDRIPFYDAPFWFKKLIAKILIRCLSIGHFDNDIILYNELRKWIETDGRPTTSNVNYHINKN